MDICIYAFVDLSCVPKYQYIYLAFTTINKLTIGRTSLFWSSPIRCSVVLMSP